MQNTSRVYGERLGCVVDKSHKLIECLRSRSFEELGNVRLNVNENEIIATSFRDSTYRFVFISLMSVLGRGVQLSTVKFANRRIIGTKDGRQKTGDSFLIYPKS